MVKNNKGDILVPTSGCAAETSVNASLSNLKQGVGTFRMEGKEFVPLHLDDSFKKVLGISASDYSDFNLRSVLPGQIYLDRSELRSEMFAGNIVEFITRLTRPDKTNFIGRVTVAPRMAEKDIYDVSVINVEGIKLVRSEPKIKAIDINGDNTIANEYIHSWHDRRYRLLLEDPSMITFDYDSETDVYTYYLTNDSGHLSVNEVENFIKNIKLHKKSKIDPNITVSQNIEEMLDRPSTREFEVHSHTKEAGYRCFSCKCKSYAGTNGRVRRVVGWFNDITVKQKEHAKLHDLAEKDGLTGIFNRAAMESFFERYFTKPKEERSGMLFFIDFDKFKYINDTYGHLAGDDVLIESTKAIQTVLRSGDYFYRYGGDEFIIFIDKLKDVASAKKRAKQIIDAVGDITVRGNIKTKCSVGFSELRDSDKDGHDAIRRADAALLHAKKGEAGSFVYYGKDGTDMQRS